MSLVFVNIEFRIIALLSDAIITFRRIENNEVYIKLYNC